MNAMEKALWLFLKDNPSSTKEDFFLALEHKPGAGKKTVRVPRRRRRRQGKATLPVWQVTGAVSHDAALGRLMVNRHLP